VALRVGGAGGELELKGEFCTCDCFFVPVRDRQCGRAAPLADDAVPARVAAHRVGSFNDADTTHAGGVVAAAEDARGAELDESQAAEALRPCEDISELDELPDAGGLKFKDNPRDAKEQEIRVFCDDGVDAAGAREVRELCVRLKGCDNAADGGKCAERSDAGCRHGGRDAGTVLEGAEGTGAVALGEAQQRQRARLAAGVAAGRLCVGLRRQRGTVKDNGGKNAVRDEGMDAREKIVEPAR
jgi:hypothetical protein